MSNAQTQKKAWRDAAVYGLTASIAPVAHGWAGLPAYAAFAVGTVAGCAAIGELLVATGASGPLWAWLSLGRLNGDEPKPPVQ